MAPHLTVIPPPSSAPCPDLEVKRIETEVMTKNRGTDPRDIMGSLPPSGTNGAYREKVPASAKDRPETYDRST